jgi:hypothetical protein
MQRSQIMVMAEELLDGAGARLTGSPGLSRAVRWAEGTMRKIGLANPHRESWGAFGSPWRERATTVRMVEPDVAPLLARAAPWSPATAGAVSAEVVAVPGFAATADFQAWRGKLRGKIVLLGRAPSPPRFIPIRTPLVTRLSPEELATFSSQPYTPPSGFAGSVREATAANFRLMRQTGEFLASEGVAAVLAPNGNTALGGANGGAIHSDWNYTFGAHVYRPGEAKKHPPLAILSIEHYGRLDRLLKRGVPVRLELNIDTELSDEVAEGENLLAEISGSDPDPEIRDQVVMVSAHLDSWPAAVGATDDGAGVLIALEAMRILRAVDARPRRTIRIALWTGEEQGALGSRSYVGKHLAAVTLDRRPDFEDLPEFMLPAVGAVTTKPEHAKVSAVYTLDAGGGRIRGISTGNPATVALFRQWLEPFRDLGVSAVAPTSDCGGDCSSFEQIGIPTPSFKQDPLAYDSQTHHTAMDLFEQLVPEDLRQAATVVAAMLYRTAMHDDLLPRR